MKKTLILAGGGHAHMVCLANLDQFIQKGFDVNVIGPSEHHYYSGMGPGMLGQIYRPEEVRFATKRLVKRKGGRFVLGKIKKIDADAQTIILESGDALSYDVLSCNLGSQVPKDMIKGDLNDIYTVKPIERLADAQQRILTLGKEKKITIGVIGGGPSAVEIAGNVWRLTQIPGMKPADIKILTDKSLMPNHPENIRRMARSSLEKRGIEIKEECRIHDIKTGIVTEQSGKEHDLDVIFLAIGVKPNRIFKDSDLPVGPDGGLRVNQYLQSTTYSNIFGGGDCIYFQDRPLDKVGVYAVRQNPVLFHNLMATLEGTTSLIPFSPGSEYLSIFNLGDGTGIFHKWRILFGGRIAFRIKDTIDRKFMTKFQAFE
ncbi:MAG: FAD-dependent oxidoreductase [Desulfobacteraceae bacterium]|jgi:NADH dehydrogenase FAD-containing subunit|nr:FAD-dependent oxidoreductase [Desulfobacteraceae bacterium]